MAISQTGRVGHLKTILPDNALSLLRLDGTETLSGAFEWQLQGLSESADVDLDSLLGTLAHVEIDHANGARFFSGIICEASSHGAMENGWRYDLVLRPWLHVAHLRRNIRIFHEKTVVQIVEEVLADYASLSSPHLEIQLTDSYPVLEYTVQYNESDADFVQRQLERFGITWSWKHSAEGHTLLLTDATYSLPAVPGGSRPYYSVDGFHQHDEEHFSRWSAKARITTGKVRLTEYNFKTPNAAMEVDHEGDAAHPNGDIESYEWPGDYTEQGEGRAVVTRRLDEQRSHAPRHAAEGDVASLGAGWRVTLSGDEIDGVTGTTFVCLGATHSFRSQSYGSGATDDAPPYAGSYTLAPEDTNLRPERRIKQPKISGPETAFVVGEDEIDCDEHGRILCKFHWDDTAAHTMRCRVSQNWASKGWGGMVIPRVGMEVIVEHLRGDPDKPIVTGCVYNGKNRPPYDLPEHKTRSTFKTDSHNSQGFNELRFEDKTGAEEIFIHAQKDRNEKTLNNHSERIDNNWVQSVGHNKAIEVNNNHDEVIGGNMTLSVGPSSIGQIVNSTASKLTEGISGIAKDFGLPGFLNPGEGNQTITVEKNKAETVGIASMEAVGVSKMTSVGKTYHINVGTKLVITCGKSQFSMDKSGYVKITGTRFNFSASGPVQINGKDIDLN